MLRDHLSSSPVQADSKDPFSIISLFTVPRDLRKESPHCNHTITKCAFSKSRMTEHAKQQRRVIFPVLHAEDFPSPRSTVDCISEISEVKKDIPAKCHLTLKDIALSRVSNMDFSNSHMLSLSPLLSREQLTWLDLDCPSRCLPEVPFAPRGETPHVKRIDSAGTEQVENHRERNTPTRSVRTYAMPSAQSTSSSGGRRSILPIQVSPLRVLSSSIGSDSFNSDISSVRSECEPVVMKSQNNNEATRYPSILRSSSYAKRSAEVEKVSSVESDIPSLASSETSDAPASPALEHRRSNSRGVVFDARVLVREFCRSEEETSCIWYTAIEMNSFKLEATKRIMAFTRTEIIPTGTGRMIERPITPTAKKALFSHAALQADSVDFPVLDNVGGLCPLEVSSGAIKRILIVDPYDICLKLFAKAFQQAIPDAILSTARTSEDALEQVYNTTFDLIVVEERLKLFHRQQPGDCGGNASGSLLLQRIATMTQKRPPVLVGVSAHLPQDAHRLQEVGQADLVWAKPPPPLSRELVMQLDGILEKKRTGDNREDANRC